MASVWHISIINELDGVLKQA